MQVLHIALQYGGQDVLRIDLRHALKALVGGKPVGDQFLQAALQLRIAFVSQGGGKADNGAFADADAFPQAGSRHEDRLVIVVGNVRGNPAVALAQPPPGVVQPFHHIPGVLHPSDPFPSFYPDRLYGEEAGFARQIKEKTRTRAGIRPAGS